MRLTQGDKETIINRIMQDVPRADYNDLARKLVKPHYLKKLPPAIKKIAQDTALQGHLRTSSIQTPSPLCNVDVWGIFGSGYSVNADLALDADLSDLAGKCRAQNEQNKELEQKLKFAFKGITTRKQAADLFPEFEKYLPAEDSALRNLPITTDVMPALVQAGWPKDQKPATKTTKRKEP
jgi:hypothetical protein